jgi:predicted transglutaminase-like cysteine proteinase
MSHRTPTTTAAAAAAAAAAATTTTTTNTLPHPHYIFSCSYRKRQCRTASTRCCVMMRPTMSKRINKISDFATEFYEALPKSVLILG